jgi:hypothetical protein
MAKKVVLAIIAAFVFAGAANAQVTMSGGFALSSAKIDTSYYEGETGIGGNLYIDYLLPIGVPLSLGVEFGVDTSSFPYSYNTGYGSYSTGEDTALAIPLLLRAAYHFDLMPKLDLYLVGKIGYVFGSVSGDSIDDVKGSGGEVEVEGGLGFGIDAGVAYYFSSLAGVFAEAGFDRYNGNYFIRYPGSSGDSSGVTFSRFFTVGLSIKF